MAASVLTPASEAQTQTASQQAGQDIAALSVTPVEQLRPGEVLAFRLNGVPGARVSVQIGGATAPLLLNETHPGHYAGGYTIRLRDTMTVGSLATARLEKDGQAATATVGQPLQAGRSVGDLADQQLPCQRAG